MKSKIEYEQLGVRILSRVNWSRGKRIKKWWIEIHSYETNTWDKLREIEPVPKNTIIKSFYEYGNGTLVPPFWDRVEKQTSKITNGYSVLNIYDKFTPKHSVGKNACGMETYKADELYRILILKKEQ